MLIIFAKIVDWLPLQCQLVELERFVLANENDIDTLFGGNDVIHAVNSSIM